MFTSTIRFYLPPRPSAVPLAVWTTPTLGDQADSGEPPWLPRLIAEYAPAGQPVLLYTLTDLTDPTFPADAEAVRSALEPDGDWPVAAAGLVVALMHQASITAEDFDRHMYRTALAVAPQGRLVVVTRHGPDPKRRRRYDRISRAVSFTRLLGFGYLQHLIITDAGEPAATRSSIPSRRQDGVPVHDSTHLDVTVLQAPAAAPNRGKAAQ